MGGNSVARPPPAALFMKGRRVTGSATEGIIISVWAAFLFCAGRFLRCRGKDRKESQLRLDWRANKARRRLARTLRPDSSDTA